MTEFNEVKLKRICQSCNGRGETYGIGGIVNKCTLCEHGWIDMVKESLTKDESQHLRIRDLPKDIPEKTILKTNVFVCENGKEITLFEDDIADVPLREKREKPPLLPPELRRKVGRPKKIIQEIPIEEIVPKRKVGRPRVRMLEPSFEKNNGI